MPINRPAPYISRTKITPPISSRSEVVRKAVLDQVDKTTNRRAVLVNAPAGFGKTTVMTQLLSRCQRQGMDTIWLTLDGGDNDVSRFLAGFSAAVASLSPANAPDLARMRNADVVSWILQRIADNPRPLAIFFDDYEAIRNPVVHGLVARGIESIPLRTCLFVGSRTLPQIGLARLRARGSLVEIDASQLRFSIQEVQDFLAQSCNVPLNDAQLEKLQKSTEGWATALWLASLAMENHGDTEAFLNSFSGSNAAIASYLAEDVLAALEPRLRDFLLRSSILDDLTPSLCNKLLKIDDSLELLQQLDQQQLFLVAVDAQRELYRYHSLFLDFLRHQMQRRHARELPELHRIACQAYLDEDRIIPAIRHALLSGDMQHATELLHQNVDALMGQGRLRLLAECLGQLPGNELARHPKLRLVQAWSTALTWGPREGMQLLAQIDEASLDTESAMNLIALKPMLLVMMDRNQESYDLGIEALGTLSTQYPFAWAMLNQALTQSSIILGLHEQSHRFVDAARQAHAGTPGDFGQVLAETAQALLDMMAGRLKQSVTRLRLARTMLSASRRRDGHGNALAAVQLAEAMYEQNNCDEAQQLLQVFTPLVQDLGLSDALITAHTLLARMADENHDRERALQLLTELEGFGHRARLPRVVASARLERAWLNLNHGDSAGAIEQLLLAEQAFDWQATTHNWFIGNDTLTPSIVRLRWMVRTGAASKAIAPLRNELGEAERQLRGRRALKLRILLAEALHLDNQGKMALRTLERAVTFAQGEGFVRTFLEEGANVQALLRELNDEQGDLDSAAFLRTPTAAGQPLEAAAASSSSLTDPLTQKELKVLQLLGQGLSNAAMAEKLFVSDSTVRTHLRNINLKLHASSRTQAVSIARKLGLCQ